MLECSGVQSYQKYDLWVSDKECLSVLNYSYICESFELIVIICVHNETYAKMITIYFDSEVSFLHDTVENNIIKDQ